MLTKEEKVFLIDSKIMVYMENVNIYQNKLNNFNDPEFAWVKLSMYGLQEEIKRHLHLVNLLKLEKERIINN